MPLQLKYIYVYTSKNQFKHVYFLTTFHQPIKIFILSANQNIYTFTFTGNQWKCSYFNNTTATNENNQTYRWTWINTQSKQSSSLCNIFSQCQETEITFVAIRWDFFFFFFRFFLSTPPDATLFKPVDFFFFLQESGFGPLIFFFFLFWASSTGKPNSFFSFTIEISCFWLNVSFCDVFSSATALELSDGDSRLMELWEMWSNGTLCSRTLLASSSSWIKATNAQKY